MADFKSKLPDFKELTKFTTKLFNDVKKSVGEIMDDYKKNRAEDEISAKEPKTEAKPEPKVEAETQPQPNKVSAKKIEDAVNDSKEVIKDKDKSE